MEKDKLILAINPGSTSTKVAIFNRDKLVVSHNILYDRESLNKFKNVVSQLGKRKADIQSWLSEEGYDVSEFVSIVARGGMLRPIPGGTYLVDSEMIKDLKSCEFGEHASNLGGLIASELGDEYGLNAYIVDPVSVDEFIELSRVSGIPQIKRKSMLHALNVKATAYQYAEKVKKDLGDLNLVIAHIGGGISVVPMQGSYMIDVNNANEMGPFSSERAGGLPVGDLAKICFSGEYSHTELKKMLRGKGGLVAYLGTNDLRKVEKMIESGDKHAEQILDAMALQIAKEIGAMATVLKGNVDAIILTGGAAYSKLLTERIENHCRFVADVCVMAGEDEMSALCSGVLRVLDGAQDVKNYSNSVLNL